MNGRQTHWHLEDIKAALRKQHGAITSLSRAWGYGRSAITHTLARSDYSIPLEQRIARALGVRPHDLWPSRWSPDGTPAPRPVAESSSSDALRSHRQKRQAA